MLKGYDKKGRRVFIFQMKNFDTEKLKVDDLYRTHFMMMEILMDSMDQSSITGFVSISDVKDATMSHVAAMSNPVTMKKSTTVFQDAYPVRPKAMHIMNVPGIFENVVSVFRGLLNDKMKERFNVHTGGGDFSILHEAVGTDILPEEYGGSNGTLQDHTGNWQIV